MPDMAAVKDEVMIRLTQRQAHYLEVRLQGLGPIAAAGKVGLSTQEASAVEEDEQIRDILDVAVSCRRPSLPSPPGPIGLTGDSSGGSPPLSSPPVSSPPEDDPDRRLFELAVGVLVSIATDESQDAAARAQAAASLADLYRDGGEDNKRSIKRLLIQADDHAQW